MIKRKNNLAVLLTPLVSLYHQGIASSLRPYILRFFSLFSEPRSHRHPTFQSQSLGPTYFFPHECLLTTAIISRWPTVACTLKPKKCLHRKPLLQLEKCSVNTVTVFISETDSLVRTSELKLNQRTKSRREMRSCLRFFFRFFFFFLHFLMSAGHIL